MTSTPLVSIITPSLNQGNFLSQSISSVLDQDYNWIEYIVMDGGSTDRSIEIISNTQVPWPKIFRWTSKPDGGQAMAINKGFCAANGSILGWLNSDDVLLPNTISRVVEYFTLNPSHLMVYGNAMWINAAGMAIGDYPTRPPEELDNLRNECFLCQPAVFFRAELIQKIGLLDTNLVTAMDYDYWIRVFKTAPHCIGYIPEYLALSRLHDDCKTIAQRKLVYFESMTVIRRHFSDLPVNWIFSYIEERLEKVQTDNKQFCNKKELFDFLKKTMCHYSREARSFIKNRLREDRRLSLNSDFVKTDITNDGWTHECCKIIIHQPSHFNNVHISFLHERPMDEPLKLDIHCNGKLAFKSTFPKNGNYTLDIPLSSELKKNNQTIIELYCDSTFIPATMDPESTDCRSLGILIHKIDLQHNQNIVDKITPNCD